MKKLAILVFSFIQLSVFSQITFNVKGTVVNKVITTVSPMILPKSWT